MLHCLPVISHCFLRASTCPQFSQVTSNIIEALVSVKRLSDFLNADELQHDARQMIKDRKLEIGDEVSAYTVCLSVRKTPFVEACNRS